MFIFVSAFSKVFVDIYEGIWYNIYRKEKESNRHFVQGGNQERRPAMNGMNQYELDRLIKWLKKEGFTVEQIARCLAYILLGE